MNPKHKTIVVTGIGGLVGQNLADLLSPRSDLRLVGIDKQAERLHRLRCRRPEIALAQADLAQPGPWEDLFRDADVVVQLQAHISGASAEPFQRNTIRSTECVLACMRRHAVKRLIHASSSAVGSAARDHYSTTKTRQERLVRGAGIDCHVLRPTLMYGRYDPKHLGYLADFMAKTPVFPVPGHGRYLRQPIYALDFCRFIERCIDGGIAPGVYDLAGPDRASYVEILGRIRNLRGLRVPFLHVPLPMFSALMRAYACVCPNPPFTSDQLRALTVGDEFPGVETWRAVGLRPTSLDDGLRMTFADA